MAPQATMDTSHLTTQVATIIGQLHGLFDDIGLAIHDRDARESELFTALSETLHRKVHLVATEKREMTEEANRMITTIKQMEISLDGRSDNDLKVTFPLLRCLQKLKEKHDSVIKVHKERFDQIKKLVEALDSYASHLETSFLKVELPPTSTSSAVPPTFDLSPSYVNSLDSEFSRVYEEYNRRVTVVQTVSEDIIKLWAELGTPQAQTDGNIVQFYREAPEQLGLHQEDISRLKAKKEKLVEEKKSRERHLKDLKDAVDSLWDRLGVETGDRKAFSNANRGCGVRVINEYEDELSRLNELKKQNLHLFVEDARFKLQDLWDALYFSEEEMLEFTPAFSGKHILPISARKANKKADVYSDALLSAHEAEIDRLAVLKEQRAPTLSLIEKHRSLVKDRNDLSSSSQDASRLMMKGQKGEKRDPGKLLREEKMRKRIAKELPKVEVELRNHLETWEDEYGRPFLVHGERYMEEIAVSEAKIPTTSRSKTPCAPPSVNRGMASSKRKVQPARPAPSRAGARTPIESVRRAPPTSSISSIPRGPKAQSPSKIPARKPLTHLTHGNNSPERRALPMPPIQSSTHQGQNLGKVGQMGPPARAPPPKMRKLYESSQPEMQVPSHHLATQRNVSVASSSNGSVRHVSPEDVYEDYERMSYLPASTIRSQHPQPSQNTATLKSSATSTSSRPFEQYSAASSRQISATSSANNTVSGSENWETFDDASEGDPDGEDQEAYYARLRAARGKRYTPEGGHSNPQVPGGKRHRGLLGAGQGPQTVYEADEGAVGRVPSGSEAGWVEYD
ncbi:MAG: hypothetical protein M1814_005528 [Vezdaea aestivalis]|nr:MAG: hypothetical protein M1814_005528 [Vezdaea aestivalis]